MPSHTHYCYIKLSASVQGKYHTSISCKTLIGSHVKRLQMTVRFIEGTKAAEISSVNSAYENAGLYWLYIGCCMQYSTFTRFCLNPSCLHCPDCNMSNSTHRSNIWKDGKQLQLLLPRKTDKCMSEIAISIRYVTWMIQIGLPSVPHYSYFHLPLGRPWEGTGRDRMRIWHFT